METRTATKTRPILEIDPCVDPLWERLVTARTSDVFQSPAWCRVLADTYGFDIRARVMLDETGSPIAGLAYTKLNDAFGERIAALPFCDYTDPLVDTALQWFSLIEPLFGQRAPLSLRTLHNTIANGDARFEQVNKARWHGVDLTRGSQALWQNTLDESARRAVRKAQKTDVTITFENDEAAIRAFFDVHLGVRKYKYHMLAQPFAFLQNIGRQFVHNGNGMVVLARHHGQVVGATLALRWGDTMYYKLSGSVRGEQTVRPSDLMMWSLIEESERLGCKTLDLGLSDWDQEGLIRYKRKYATEEKTISFLKYTPEGHALTPAQAQSRKTISELTALLVDPSVPDAITEQAGNLLYRHFA